MKQHKWHKDKALKMAIKVMKSHKDYWWFFEDAINACKEALKPHPQCDEACMFLCQAIPLSDGELKLLINKYVAQDSTCDAHEFARAIEEAHGIGEYK